MTDLPWSDPASDPLADLRRAIQEAYDRPWQPSPPPVFGVMQGHVLAGYEFRPADVGEEWAFWKLTAGEELRPGDRLMIDPKTGKIVKWREA